MVWFVIDKVDITVNGASQFQTKLTYGMICYKINKGFEISDVEFQTKLTYGMICYANNVFGSADTGKFQTKLTYGMICYSIIHNTRHVCGRVSN